MLLRSHGEMVLVVISLSLGQHVLFSYWSLWLTFTEPRMSLPPCTTGNSDQNSHACRQATQKRGLPFSVLSSPEKWKSIITLYTGLCTCSWLLPGWPIIHLKTSSSFPPLAGLESTSCRSPLSAARCRLSRAWNSNRRALEMILARFVERQGANTKTQFIILFGGGPPVSHVPSSKLLSG